MRRALSPSKQQRGAAMVEFAILMLVLIPLLLYSFFLMDAAYMKLDLQETVVSGIWDFANRNSEGRNTQAEVNSVQESVRVIYSDHTSTFDDGADPSEPGYNDSRRLNSKYPSDDAHSKKHHIGLGAHYRFTFNGNQDTQFKCAVNEEDMDWALEPNLRAYAGSDYAGGGQVTCTATGFIFNYIIPEEFMQEFAGDVKMSPMKKEADGADVHNATGAGAAVANIKAHSSASVSFNTWALINGTNDGSRLTNSNADIGARSTFGFGGGPSLNSNPFFQRVQHMYTRNGLFVATYGMATASGVDLMSKAASEKLMAVVAVPFVNPPMPIHALPNVLGTYLTARYRPQSPGVRQPPPGLIAGQLHSGFQSTPYRTINTDYTTAYSKRGLHYLGCRQAEGQSCNY
jgi:hypothetical protein